MPTNMQKFTSDQNNVCDELKQNVLVSYNTAKRSEFFTTEATKS